MELTPEKNEEFNRMVAQFVDKVGDQLGFNQETKAELSVGVKLIYLEALLEQKARRK